MSANQCNKMLKYNKSTTCSHAFCFLCFRDICNLGNNLWKPCTLPQKQILEYWMLNPPWKLSFNCVGLCLQTEYECCPILFSTKSRETRANCWTHESVWIGWRGHFPLNEAWWTADGRMLNTSNVFLRGCMMMCIFSTIDEFCFSCQTQYTKQHAHISPCITEFIGLLMYHLMMDTYTRHNSVVKVC